MIKYPVVSENNNKYQIKIFEGKKIHENGLNIVIYRCIDFKLFKIKKKLISYNNSIADVNYDFYKNNYIQFVKNAVYLYECKLEKEKKKLESYLKNKKNFKKWNGIC